MSATSSRRNRIGAGIAAVAVAASVAVGWAAPATARTAHPSASSAAKDNTFTVVAHDGTKKMWFNIHGAPHQGRIAIHFTNHGKYAHEMALMRLKKGATLAQFKKAMQQPDFEQAAGKLLADPSGEITGPAQLGPGMRETVYARLKAGNYVVICFLPGPDGMPHAMMGMVGAIRVRPSIGGIMPPKTDGTVRLTNHKIVLPENFAQGGTFAVINTGTRAHSFSLAKLKGNTDLSTLFGCVGQSFATNSMIDNCPGTLAGGVTDIAPGRTAYLRVPLAKGHYGFVSTDGNDFAKGLNGTFTVR